MEKVDHRKKIIGYTLAAIIGLVSILSEWLFLHHFNLRFLSVSNGCLLLFQAVMVCLGLNPTVGILFVAYWTYYREDGSEITTVIDNCYAVDMATGEVVASGKKRWGDTGTKEYQEAAGEY